MEETNRGSLEDEGEEQASVLDRLRALEECCQPEMLQDLHEKVNNLEAELAALVGDDGDEDWPTPSLPSGCERSVPCLQRAGAVQGNDQLINVEQIVLAICQKAMAAIAPAAMAARLEDMEKGCQELRTRLSEEAAELRRCLGLAEGSSEELKKLKDNVQELTYATSRHAARTAERLDDLERAASAGAGRSEGPRVPRHRLRSNTEDVATAERDRALAQSLVQAQAAEADKEPM